MSDSHLRVCRGCGQYTMKERCPSCGGATRTPHPARFSPQDRWGSYRRALWASRASEAHAQAPKEGD